MKKTAKQAATVSDVARCVAALEREVRKLVGLVGDDAEDISTEAVHALSGVSELIARSLASAISRPRSRQQTVKLIFLARLLGPRGSLDLQKALLRVAKQEGDDRLADSAATVLGELLGDEMEARADEARRGRGGPRGSAHVDAISSHELLT